MFKCREQDCQYKALGIETYHFGLMIRKLVDDSRKKLKNARETFLSSRKEILSNNPKLIDYFKNYNSVCSDHEPRLLFEATGVNFPYGCCGGQQCCENIVKSVQHPQIHQLAEMLISLENDYSKQVRHYVDALKPDLYSNYRMHFSYLQLNPPGDPWRVEQKVSYNSTIEQFVEKIKDRRCWDFHLETDYKYNCIYHPWVNCDNKVEILDLEMFSNFKI